MKEETKRSAKLGLWCIIGAVVGSIIYGFLSGGLVLGSTSVHSGESMTEKAVIECLPPIHLPQAELDNEKEAELKMINSQESRNPDENGRHQGWATKPFCKIPDGKTRGKKLTMEMD